MKNVLKSAFLFSALTIAATIPLGKAHADIYSEMRVSRPCLKGMLNYVEPLLNQVNTSNFNPCSGFFEDNTLDLRITTNQSELNRLLQQVNLSGGPRFRFEDKKLQQATNLWQGLHQDVRLGHLGFGQFRAELEETPGFSLPGGGSWGDPHYTRFTGFTLNLANGRLDRNYQNFDLHQLGIHDLYSRPNFQINVRQVPCNTQFGHGYHFDLNCNGAYGFMIRDNSARDNSARLHKMIFGYTDYGRGQGFEEVNPGWHRNWTSALYGSRSELDLLRIYQSTIKRHADMLGMGTKTRPIGINWGFWHTPWGKLESIIHRPWIRRGNGREPEQSWNSATVADYYYVGPMQEDPTHWDNFNLTTVSRASRVWNTYDELRTWIEGDTWNDRQTSDGNDLVDLQEDSNVTLFKMAGVPSRPPVVKQNTDRSRQNSRLFGAADRSYTYWNVRGGKFNNQVAVPTICVTGAGTRTGLGFYNHLPWAAGLDSNGVRHGVKPSGFVYDAHLQASNDDVYLNNNSFTEAQHLQNCRIFPVTNWNNDDRQTPDTYTEDISTEVFNHYTTTTKGDFKDPINPDHWYFKSDLVGKFGGRFTSVDQYNHFFRIVDTLRRLHLDQRNFLLHLTHTLRPKFVANLNGHPLPFRKKVTIPGTDVSFYWDQLGSDGEPTPGFQAFGNMTTAKNVLLIQTQEVQMAVAQEGVNSGSFGSAFTFKGNPFYKGVAVGGLLGSTIDFNISNSHVNINNFITPVVRRLLNRHPNLCHTGNANAMPGSRNEVYNHPVWLLNGTPQQWTANPFSDPSRMIQLPMLPSNFYNFTVHAGGYHDVLTLGDAGSRFNMGSPAHGTNYPFPTCNGFLPIEYQLQAEEAGL